MSVTLVIVIITGLVSYQCFNDRSLFDRLKHHPYTESRHGEYHRMLTSGFVHGDWVHLIVNMYVLHEFGTVVETIFIQAHGLVLGRVLYLLMYLIIIVIADLPSFFQHRDNPGYASIGASGAVSGVLFTYVLFSPWSLLGLFFVIPIPAIIFAVLYLVYSSWAGKNMNDRIDHSAHFTGAVAGLILTMLIIPRSIQVFINQIVDIPWF